MGVRLNIGGTDYETSSYSIQEDSSPTKSDDSTGSVGTFSFEIPKVPDLEPALLLGKPVSFRDSRRGSTVGHVSTIQETDHGMLSVSCLSRLGKLNIYGVQAQPFRGTLRQAFEYYLRLAEQDFDLLVDPQIANRPVVFQGWYGELWYYFKQMAAAQDCEVALVSNVILLRPLRQREAVDHRDISRSRTYGGTQLAKAVEVYHYDNTYITDKLVYPPGGWSNEVEIISVGAGETVERVLELSASVTSIKQPEMETFVGPDEVNRSVFTIVGDDGLPIQPEQWTDYGGRLSVKINSDTNTLTLTITGASNIANKDGSTISSYSIALGSDVSGNRYSTLRIVGTGVQYNKQLVRVRTCLDDRLTGTEVGITIDNPFISTLDQAYSAGVKAAKVYAGEEVVINGQVTTINQLGDNGAANYPKYSYDQTQHSGKTHAAVALSYAGKTYGQIEEAYYVVVRDDFDNQVFGNANGVRVWDRKSKRYYRVRSATVTTENVSFEAEDDLLHGDIQNKNYGMTYAQDAARFAGVTYSDRDKMGIV